MARATGPLFSIKAQGQIGKGLIFQQNKSRNVVKRYAAPANPRTQPQFVNRLAPAMLTQAWSQLTAPNRASWQALAQQTNLSPYHAYLRENLRRFSAQQHMAANYPVTEAGDPPFPADPILLETNGTLSIETTISDALTTFYHAYFLDTAPLPTIDWTKLVALMPSWDTPYAPGEFKKNLGVMPAATYYAGFLAVGFDGQTLLPDYYATYGPYVFPPP